MNRSPREVSLTIVGGPADDEEDVDVLTRALATELREATSSDVSLPRVERAPEGAKGDFVAIGELVVSVVGALPAVVTAIKGWIGRSPATRIRVELDGDPIEIVNPSSEDQERLINAWLERHGERDPG